jgi:hypothetical protein
MGRAAYPDAAHGDGDCRFYEELNDGLPLKGKKLADGFDLREARCSRISGLDMTGDLPPFGIAYDCFATSNLDHRPASQGRKQRFVSQ